MLREKLDVVIVFLHETGGESKDVFIGRDEFDDVREISTSDFRQFDLIFNDGIDEVKRMFVEGEREI